jgi:hypothetical protein
MGQIAINHLSLDGIISPKFLGWFGEIFNTFRYVKISDFFFFSEGSDWRCDFLEAEGERKGEICLQGKREKENCKRVRM